MIQADNYLFPVEPRRSRLLSDLWQCQLTDKYISREAIRLLAIAHQLSEVEVEGVASFYHFFHFQPSGKHTIYLNNSIIAELKGFEKIKTAFEQHTGARIGTVDPSGTFGLFTTPCIGLSDQEPAALIDFYPFVNLTEEKVKDIIEQLRQGKKPQEICDDPADNIRYLPDNNKSIFFAPYSPGEAVATLQDLTPDAILDQLQKAVIKGRGGAFFPTWVKWNTCRKQPASPKFIICNADEGEPGTFKDRVLLHHQTGSMLEGMIIAGYTVGASYGIIYLRGEYWWLEEKIQQEIVAFRSKGLLGPNAGGIKGFRFDIRVEMGAGAYVCGEETALIESLEGSRGEPRTKWQFPLERKYRQLLIGENNVEPRAKWYFPVERGYLQLPTVVNNVETFCLVARLLQLGLPEYLTRGIPVSPGTKLISISGDCRLPGIYEIEWGKTISELLELCQADDPYLMQVSGPSGQSISMAESKYQICMPGSGIQDSITCGGSLMIFNQQNDLLKILLNFAEFFKHESCGVCTPCRAGNFIIQRKLTQLLHGIGDLNDLEDLKKWAGIMEASSRCGLGKTSGNAIIHTINKFQGYFSARFPATDNHGIRAFDIAAAIAEYDHFKPTSS